MKTIAIGDIHGALSKLKALIHVLGDKDLLKERVIFLGDYIDRGEDSFGTLDYLIKLKEKYPHWHFLRGNHEEMLLEANRFKRKTEISKHYLHEFRDRTGKVRLSVQHSKFLESLDLSYKLGHILFTHGGINKAGKVDTWACGIEGQLPRGIKLLVRGHVIHPYPTFYQYDIAIDTGAYQQDGFLSAVIFDEYGFYDAPVVISIGTLPEHILRLVDAPFVSTKRIRIQMWPHTNISHYRDLEEARLRYSGYKKEGPLSDREVLNLLNQASSYAIHLLEEKVLIGSQTYLAHEDCKFEKIHHKYGKCPECSSLKAEIEATIEHDPVDDDPWSKVCEIIQCGGCHRIIPEHIWFTNDEAEELLRNKEWQEKYRNRPNGFHGRNLFEKAECPECGSDKPQVSWVVNWQTTENPKKRITNPWSKISDVTLCSKCHQIIPTFLWDLWDGLTRKKAKPIWQKIFRNNPSGLESERDQYFQNENAKNDPLKVFQRKAIKFLQAGKMKELVTICNKGIKASGENPISLEFIKLRGIGFAEQGRVLEAKDDFLNVLEKQPDHDATLSNYLAACFDSGDKDSAIKGLKIFYSELTVDVKERVLENLIHALKIDQVRVEELPEEFIDLASKRLKKGK